MSGHRIRIVGATKRYGTLNALDDFSLEIEPGEFTVLLGPSGSGKSTLIRSLAGIEKLTEGSIFLGDVEVNRGPHNVPPEKRDLAMVFQDYALWPHMSAEQNVAYALRRRNLDTNEAVKRTREALERVGLGGKHANYPHELSGGEQQRVALARAIVARPKLLLFDEPLSNLDADLRERLRIEIGTLTREIGATALYITHDQSEAFALADKVGVLRHGKLQQFSKPEDIYQDPANKFVAEFTGLGGTLSGKLIDQEESHAIVSVGDSTMRVRMPRHIKLGVDVEIMLRPSSTSMKSFEKDYKENHIRGVVKDAAYRGRGYEHVVETESGEIHSVFDFRLWQRGADCSVKIDDELAMAFQKESRI